MRLLTLLSVLSFALGLAQQASAATVFVDFESLSDSEPVTTQFPGLTFSGATVLTAGISLNEIDFPPHSGLNSAIDEGGPITILLDVPATLFSGFFTYVLPVTVQAFDATDTLVASATSQFLANWEVGSTPNEEIGLFFAGGFSRLVLTGDPSGTSFFVDDISVGDAVPEPSTFGLLLAGVLVGLALRKRMAYN